MDRPVLIFDGACGFCRRSVGRARRITGDRIEYLAQQDAACARRFPQLEGERLAESVHLVECDGRVSRGARAMFRAVAVNPRWSWLLRRYERWVWFARSSEAIYRWVARHRTLMSRVTRPFLPED